MNEIDEIVEVATKSKTSPVYFWVGLGLGLGVGCAVSYFIVKDRFEKAYNAEVTQVRDAYARRLEQLEDDFNQPQQDDEETTENKPDPRKIKVLKEVPKPSEKLQKRYDKIIKEGQYKKETGMDIDVPMLDDMNDPFMIVEDSFNDDFIEYSKVSLVFYAQSGILVDEMDKPVDNPEEYIGTEAWEALTVGEVDVAYARNHHLEADYEVTRNEQED